MRLIELGNALRMIQNSKDDCPETSIKGRAIWVTAHNCALSCLTNCPTVDAVEVVHGKWNAIDECANSGVYCSVCHRKIFKECYGNCKLRSNYCPNCGAKMDGDGNV